MRKLDDAETLQSCARHFEVTPRLDKFQVKCVSPLLGFFDRIEEAEEFQAELAAVLARHTVIYHVGEASDVVVGAPVG